MTNKVKNTICPVCNNKLGFLKHEFENDIRVCNSCFASSGINIKEIADRGQRNISIDEIKDRVNTSIDYEKTCGVCRGELTFFGTHELMDAKICSSCLSLAKLTLREMTGLKNTRLADVKNRISGDVENFKSTKEIGDVAKFNDEDKKLLLMPGQIIDYKDIKSYELLEDGDTIASGGLGRAALGGMIFGGAGAVVGAVTGNRRGNCRSLQIKITVDNQDHSATYITFIDKKIKKNSAAYKSAVNDAQECLSTLELICGQQESAPESDQLESNADEIMKYKKLLDAGAITEEEYDSKKKELLEL